jgi:predicted lipoprotein with Yx(FWY)xxD motif
MRHAKPTAGLTSSDSKRPGRPGGRRPRLAPGVLVLAALALTAAACGKSGSAGTSSPAAGGGGSSSTPMASSGGSVVKTASVAKYGTILVDASNGHTLYYFTPDKPGHIACTGGCAQAWPPLTVPAGTSVSGMSGLGTTSRPDGSTQVTYNGHPLYTYTGDSAAGQTNGEGVGGTWFVNKVASAGGGGTTSTTSSGGSSWGG